MTILSIPAAAHGFWYDVANWPGRNMTGAVAGVLAALAVIPAVIRYFRDRHRPNVGRLTLDTYATTHIGGSTYHLGELGNGGGAAVSIIAIGLVHARMAWTEAAIQPRWWLGVGGSVTVPYLVTNQQQAWMLVTYVGEDNTSQSRTIWLPLFAHSDAMDAHMVAFDAHKRRRWWQGRLWFKEPEPKAVGPGGAWAEIRRSKTKVNGNSPDDYLKILQIFTDQSGQWYSAGMAAAGKTKTKQT